MIDEFERENKDLKKTTILGMLDAKSAFDVVRHSNMIRKLYHLGLSEQSMLLIDSLYTNATTKIKWNGQLSESFNIEQGVRQGGTLSADLYKIYINQLLNLLEDSNLGGKIGSISCCAPTCADDIALVSDNPYNLQATVNIASDYSKREGYHLQPTKSVILPVKTSNRLFDNIDLDLNGELMPVVDKTPHIGIQRAFKDSASATIEENLKKARRSLYSLMASGLHGENGLDPVTAISLVKTYIIPVIMVMLYVLETLRPNGKNLDLINKQYKKMLKQILSLTTNVADYPVVYMVYIISGQLPAEAEIHKS